jgi:hypothetical protein
MTCTVTTPAGVLHGTFYEASASCSTNDNPVTVSLTDTLTIEYASQSTAAMKLYMDAAVFTTSLTAAKIVAGQIQIPSTANRPYPVMIPVGTFTSASSYYCTATDSTLTGILYIVQNLTANAFTIVPSGNAPAGDPINYTCIGN